MCSGPSDIHVLARENAIPKWRELMGPTKVFQAQFTAPDTIRGKYGLSDTRNATHGSGNILINLFSVNNITIFVLFILIYRFSRISRKRNKYFLQRF